MERANDPDAKFDIVTFDLANGTKVRAVIDEFWEQLSEDDLRQGHKPNLYYGIRVYSDEGTNPRRLADRTEFRAGIDFEQRSVARLWTWLQDLAISRHRYTYDCVEDFLHEFDERMNEFSAIGEDVADLLHKSHWTKEPPPYENPPHGEFSEGESRSTKEESSVVDANAESDRDDPTEDRDIGPTYPTKDQDEDIKAL